MKKKRKENRGQKEFKELEKEFISFGNRKRVFWSITLATIILSLIGIPIMINDKIFLRRFLIIWILELIYIIMWIRWGERKLIKRH